MKIRIRPEGMSDIEAKRIKKFNSLKNKYKISKKINIILSIILLLQTVILLLRN